MNEHTKDFPATGTAGGPGGGGCPQPSCANCENLRFELAIMRADEEIERNWSERAERDRDEACARVAVLEEERKILARERDEARVSCAEWRACARSLARVVDYLKPDLRDENDGWGWSQERMAMRLYDKMEAAK